MNEHKDNEKVNVRAYESKCNELKRMLDECSKRLEISENDNRKQREQIELQESVIKELYEKIKFLEGQVEAYQYCMNCRR